MDRTLPSAHFVLLTCALLSSLALTACARTSAPSPERAGGVRGDVAEGDFAEPDPTEPEAASDSGSRGKLSSSPGSDAAGQDSEYYFHRVPQIELALTPEVMSAVDEFSGRRKVFIVDSLKHGKDYLPKIERILSRFNLPTELSNVALVESRFRARAKSRSGARGIWQFMKPTAKKYGLRVGYLQDDRTNVERSTIAAAKYLEDLYESFDSWVLAIAAYNAGPARIRRAMKRCGSQDVFELHRCGGIRRETADFVARFSAVTIILRDPEHYGLASELSFLASDSSDANDPEAHRVSVPGSEKRAL